MRYGLRTLLILLAVLPPLMWFGWTKYEAWLAEQARREAIETEAQANPARAFQRAQARRAAQRAAMARWESDLAKSRDSTAARQGLQRLSDSMPFIRQQSKSI